MLKTVLLIMRRASLAQGLMAKVQDAPGLQLCYEPDYANADVAIRSHLATGALLEVAAAPRTLTFAWPCAHGCGRSRPTAASCSCARRGRQRRSSGPSRPSGRGRSTISYFMMCPWIIWPPACSPFEACRE